MAIGVLMNARGLMESILLNIGLQQGIITPPLFAILVLITMVTTLIASPIFELVYGHFILFPQSGRGFQPCGPGNAIERDSCFIGHKNRRRRKENADAVS
jgi:hypothetical protein